MVKPLYKMKINHFYEEFLTSAAISAFTALIAIRVNENFTHNAKLCKSNKLDTIRCYLMHTPFYDNFELFLATFMSAFVAYTAFYMLTGYGYNPRKK